MEEIYEVKRYAFKAQLQDANSRLRGAKAHLADIAMRRAALGLPIEPGFVLVDGKFTPKLPWPSAAQARADETEPTVSAASVLAKVYRDRYMRELDKQFPEYGFRQHKGYPTRVHLEALEHYGPSLAHRFSFRPVREACPQAEP